MTSDTQASLPPAATGPTAAVVVAPQLTRWASAHAVFEIAHMHFNEKESESPAPLVGADLPADNIVEQLKTAHSLLISNKERAREVFNQILSKLPSLQVAPHSVIKAACEIGIALTYPEKSHEMLQHIALAREENDKIYEHRVLWDDLQKRESGKFYPDEASWKYLDKAEKIATYTGLIQNYSTLVHLVPEESPEDIKAIQQRIEEVKKILTSLPKPAAPETGATPPVPPPRSPKPSTDAPATDEPKVPPPRKVTPGPVGESSRIRMIFGLAIIALATWFLGAVIYKRFVVQK